ncbi:MAG: hypothetical protein HY815_31230 [Candidatus Riflebacteria bacterium]|nr:hypothetical protein [Candidatus Riflebacteria bacterium]
MIVPDVNLLVYAYNADAPSHATARAWWEGLLNGAEIVGIPWVVSLGFIRLMTHPAVLVTPLSPALALGHVRTWLARPQVEIAAPGPRHLEILGQLLDALGVAADVTSESVLRNSQHAPGVSGRQVLLAAVGVRGHGSLHSLTDEDPWHLCRVASFRAILRSMSTPCDRTPPAHLHRLAEERSLAYHRAVVLRLPADPGLLARARSRVEQWLKLGGRSAEYARRWREILDRPLADILAVLTDEGEEAKALRQATPFAGAIDPRERWRLWREVKSRIGGRP